MSEWDEAWASAYANAEAKEPEEPPFRLTADEEEQFLEHMRAGMRRGAAAEAMGRTRWDVVGYIKRNEGFEARVQEAEEHAVEHVEEAVYQAASSGHIAAAKMWLERMKPSPKRPPMPDLSVNDPRAHDDDEDPMDEELRDILRAERGE